MWSSHGSIVRGTAGTVRSISFVALSSAVIHTRPRVRDLPLRDHAVVPYLCQQVSTPMGSESEFTVCQYEEVPGRSVMLM